MTLTSAHTQRTTFAFFEQLVKMRCVLKVQSVSNLIDGLVGGSVSLSVSEMCVLKVQSVSNLIDGLVGGRKFHLCLHHQLAADVA